MARVQGNLVINYNWNRWPNPDGSKVPYGEWRNPGPATDYRYQFPCVTLNLYAGNGKFRYEEDLYCAPAYLEIKDLAPRHGPVEALNPNRLEPPSI